jgi:hypothetical protein
MMPQGTGPTWPRSDWDDLVVTADGRKVGELDTPTLTAAIERLQVPGFLYTSGREGNIRAFSYARAKVFNDAGNAAVTAWLKGSP